MSDKRLEIKEYYRQHPRVVTLPKSKLRVGVGGDVKGPNAIAKEATAEQYAILRKFRCMPDIWVVPLSVDIEEQNEAKLKEYTGELEALNRDLAEKKKELKGAGEAKKPAIQKLIDGLESSILAIEGHIQALKK